MRRFFFRPEERNGDTVTLDEAESHHVKRVLRLGVGDALELLDGSGALYVAEIVNIEKQVKVVITSMHAEKDEDAPSLWVGQGLLKAKKMDSVIQKCTELGVTHFTPFISSRCQGRPDTRQLQKKHERWLRIIEESCKQCSRSRKMVLENPVDFDRALQANTGLKREKKLLLWEEEQSVRLQDVGLGSGFDGVQLLLGPEGGFSRDEIESSRRQGWQTVSLGQRILRAETATYASVAIVQHLLGSI